ncbi:MAG: methylenetetrahydrofolate--tRNA-(uracil(54)-C(5))-methyltransferase (FADH(2)-oxidizing) TrmFO [Candidatus Riflebacteria bacterium]|nr:methylenetetrahydrofolate--tRNA-(uracil(54)-C(5))-methyltransferase (FADH(2)-oxidizing) TrmFO [Candidatus Riflebacteria bacterium]
MPKKNNPAPVTIIGGGLAGTEATYQLVRRGIPVKLFEMRPRVETGAHQTDLLGELVCSNSLGSNLPDRASGLLKEELRAFGSYILDTAYKYRVPAGNALAVDRDAFAREITRYVKGHSMVEFVNEEATDIPEEGLVIVASGPLTSKRLLDHLVKRFGQKSLSFFDAIAPIVEAESIDMTRAYRGDRYSLEPKGDYINCPMTREEYETFVDALLKAKKIDLPAFEKEAKKKFFSACQPVEQIAASGREALRFGPLKPVGLVDPVSKHRSYAVLQLRQDNLLSSLYNLVGCQTNLVHGEQERVFRLIPALRNAKFVRLGQMHRNSYLYSPKFLTTTLQVKDHPNWFLAGQITGVEGYTESTGTGLLAGLNAARITLGKTLVDPPPATMLGALLRYITFPGHKQFTPMNANFGLFGDDKAETADDRRAAIITEARRAFRAYFQEL